MKNRKLFKAFSLAYRSSIDILSGLAVGFGLGYLTDRAFNSGPWGLIGFMIIGAIAGLLNMYRSVMKLLQEDHSGDRHG